MAKSVDNVYMGQAFKYVISMMLVTSIVFAAPPLEPGPFEKAALESQKTDLGDWEKANNSSNNLQIVSGSKCPTEAGETNKKIGQLQGAISQAFESSNEMWKHLLEAERTKDILKALEGLQKASIQEDKLGLPLPKANQIENLENNEIPFVKSQIEKTEKILSEAGLAIGKKDASKSSLESAQRLNGEVEKSLNGLQTCNTANNFTDGAVSANLTKVGEIKTFLEKLLANKAEHATRLTNIKEEASRHLAAYQKKLAQLEQMVAALKGERPPEAAPPERNTASENHDTGSSSSQAPAPATSSSSAAPPASQSSSSTPSPFEDESSSSSSRSSTSSKQSSSSSSATSLTSCTNGTLAGGSCVCGDGTESSSGNCPPRSSVAQMPACTNDQQVTAFGRTMCACNGTVVQTACKVGVFTSSSSSTNLRATEIRTGGRGATSTLSATGSTVGVINASETTTSSGRLGASENQNRNPGNVNEQNVNFSNCGEGMVPVGGACVAE